MAENTKATTPPDNEPRIAAKNDRIVWIDCEMTGLDSSTGEGADLLVEIAALVTDAELNILGEGVDLVIGASAEQLERMDDVVQQMHANSGLTEAIKSSTVTVAEAEKAVLEYIQQWVPNERTAPLAGNSIATDRRFIARDMPELDSFLHYRMIDVSSIKELCRRWYPRIYFGQPDKGMAHRALADIEESIRELRYYRATAFVPQPGPSSKDVAQAAQQILGEETTEATAEMTAEMTAEHPET